MNLCALQFDCLNLLQLFGGLLPRLDNLTAQLQLIPIDGNQHFRLLQEVVVFPETKGKTTRVLVIRVGGLLVAFLPQLNCVARPTDKTHAQHLFFGAQIGLDFVEAFLLNGRLKTTHYTSHQVFQVKLFGLLHSFKVQDTIFFALDLFEFFMSTFFAQLFDATSFGLFVKLALMEK